MNKEMSNLEDIPELFATRYSRRNMNNSRNALERIGEIALNKVLDDDDVDFVAVLGIHLPQRISLSGSRDSDQTFNAAVNQNMVDFLTLERGTPPSRGVRKRVSRCIRTRQ